MKYDFTTIMERRGHDAIAVDLVGKEGFPITAPKEGNESLVSGQTTYYTLDGRPTSTITAPGLYLKHTNGATQKVWIR